MTVLRVVAALALAALLLVSLVPVFGPWPGDMIAPFRVQLALVAVVGLVVATALRDWRVVGLAVVAVAANLLPMALRIMDRPVLPETAPGQAISLVFANVLCDSSEYDRVVTLVRAQDSDIFAAVETTADWVAQLEELKDQYPYRFAPTTLDVFGVALYAKRPFSASLDHVGGRRLPLLRADFGDMIVYVAHPMPPATQRLTADNREYIEVLARQVGEETRPVVIAGDLNTTLWSSNIDPLLRQSMQWPTNSGMAYTWPAARPWMAIQIDQVLTLGMKAGRYETLGDVGSDHYPVRAELVM